MSTYNSEPVYVYLVRRGNFDRIEFVEPNVSPSGMTGEAPHGFDGGWCHRTPKYPAILITHTDHFRHVPNTLVRNDEELETWRKRYWAMKVWVYEAPDSIAASQSDNEAAMARNLQRTAENKAIGDKAVEA